MNLRETIKKVIKEESDFSQKFKRRIVVFKEFIYHCFPMLYPCDYEDFTHFMMAINSEIEEYASGIYDTDDNNPTPNWLTYEEGVDFVETYMLEDLKRHYVEMCLMNDDLNENVEHDGQKDLSPMIEKLLESIIESDIVCGVEVTAPWNRESLEFNRPFRHYKILVKFIGGPGTDYYPLSLSNEDMYHDIMDKIWQAVYNYLGLATDIYSRKSRECDDKEQVNESNVPGAYLYFNDTETIRFSKILDKYMSKYDWWKGIEIKSMSYINLMKRVNLYAKLNVDEAWGEKQSKIYRGKTFSRDKEELALGEIIGGNLSDEMKEDISNVFEFTFGLPVKSFNILDIILNSVSTKKEEENEGVGGYAAPAFEMKPDHVHFKHQYNEEISPENKESKIEYLKELIKTPDGINFVKNAIGLDNLIKIGFDDDIKEFYKESYYVPYQISNNEMAMYIDETLVNNLNLKDMSSKEKSLGDFSFGNKNGIKYKFNGRLYGPFSGSNGQRFWKVLGMCGDSGFGYSIISKKNTLGKKYRKQIFNQIIDKYNLQEYN